MKIYLDIVFFINFFIDFILLYGTKKILKRNTSLKRLLLGSLIASFTVIYVFLELTSFKLFVYKLIMSILIIITTFGLKNFKQNLLYFYILSIILGGSMYLLDFTKIYKNSLFVNNPYILNFILLIVITPIIIKMYINEHKKYKLNISNKYIIEIIINEKIITLEAILDTGNNLLDPYKKRPIILIDKEVELKRKRPIYVPYKALNTEGIIKCVLPEKVKINNKEFKNCLVGLSKDKFSLNGVSCILPNQFKEDLC